MVDQERHTGYDEDILHIATTVTRLERTLTAARHFRPDVKELAAELDEGIDTLRAAATESGGWTFPMLGWLEKARPIIFGVALTAAVGALGALVVYESEALAGLDSRIRGGGPQTGPTATTRRDGAKKPTDAPADWAVEEPAAGPVGPATAAAAAAALAAARSDGGSARAPSSPDGSGSPGLGGDAPPAGGEPPSTVRAGDESGPLAEVGDPSVPSVGVGEDGVEVPGIEAPEVSVGPVDVPPVSIPELEVEVPGGVLLPEITTPPVTPPGLCVGRLVCIGE